MPHPLNYRRPTTQHEPEKRKRTFLEMLVAQWPFFLGLASIGLGLLTIREVMGGAMRRGSRLGLYLIAFGVAMILYWAFANEKPKDYNF